MTTPIHVPSADLLQALRQQLDHYIEAGFTAARGVSARRYTPEYAIIQSNNPFWQSRKESGAATATADIERYLYEYALDKRYTIETEGGRSQLETIRYYANIALSEFTADQLAAYRDKNGIIDEMI